MTVTSWATLIRKNKKISRILNCTNVKKFSKTIGNTFNKYNRGFRTLKLGPLKKKSGLVLFPILTYDCGGLIINEPSNRLSHTRN